MQGTHPAVHHLSAGCNFNQVASVVNTRASTRRVSSAGHIGRNGTPAKDSETVTPLSPEAFLRTSIPPEASTVAESGQEKLLGPLPPPVRPLPLSSIRASALGSQPQPLTEEHSQAQKQAAQSCTQISGGTGECVGTDQWLHRIGLVGNRCTNHFTLDPFDPVTCGRRRKEKRNIVSAKRSPTSPDDKIRKKRSPSSSRERSHRELEHFRPSFRADWLCALRRELLEDTLEEHARMRQELSTLTQTMVAKIKSGEEAVRWEFAEAVAEIRHDFAAAFDWHTRPRGEATGDAAAFFRRRVCNVNFSPVLEGIERMTSSIEEELAKIRRHLNNLTEKVDSASDVIVGMAPLKAIVLDETAKLKAEVLEELRSVKTQFEADRFDVDFDPLFDAIGHIDTASILEVVKRIDAKPHVDLHAIHDVVLSAVPAPPSLEPVFESISELMTETQTSKAAVLEKINGASQDQVAAMTQLSEASREDFQNIDFSMLRSDIAGDVKKLLAEKPEPKLDLKPVIEAVSKADRSITSIQGAVIKHIDIRHRETQQDLLAFSTQLPANLQAAIDPVCADLANVLERIEGVDSKQATTLEGVSAISANLPVDLQPVLRAISKMDVRPVVDLQGPLDAIAKVLETIGFVQDSIGHMQDSIGELDESSKFSSDLQLSAVDKLHVATIAMFNEQAAMSARRAWEDASARRTADADLTKALSAAFTDAHAKEVELINDSMSKILESVSEIDVQPEVHLDPVLYAVTSLRTDVSTVVRTSAAEAIEKAQIIDHGQTQRLNEFQDEVMDTFALHNTTLTSELTNVKAELLDMLTACGADAHSDFQNVLSILGKIAAKPSIDSNELERVVSTIDVKPVVDIQPVLDGVLAKFDANVVLKPVRDAISIGLAQMEHMNLQADLEPVLRSIQQIDNRILEAISRTDQVNYPDMSHNFRWATTGLK